jgi:hypothetical protein
VASGEKGMSNKIRKIRSSLVLCFLMGMFLALPVWAQEKPVGKIISIKGFVEILVSEPVAEAKPGEVKKVAAEVWQQVKKKRPIYAKDKFRTGRKSRLKILFQDNSLMALGPKTKISVESYLFKPEDKLRQGVIKVAHGLSMYIVNKSQKNKDSVFRIVSPTGNLAARGTFGFVSSSPTKTIVANKTGAMSASNVDPNVAGSQLVGANSVSTIPQGQAPSVPQTMSNNNFNTISSVVLGRIGTSLPASLLKQDSGTTQQSTSDSEDSGDSDSGSSDSSSDSSDSDSGDSDSGDSSSGDSGDSGGGDSIVKEIVENALGALGLSGGDVPPGLIGAISSGDEEPTDESTDSCAG